MERFMEEGEAQLAPQNPYQEAGDLAALLPAAPAEHGRNAFEYVHPVPPAFDLYCRWKLISQTHAEPWQGMASVAEHGPSAKDTLCHEKGDAQECISRGNCNASGYCQDRPSFPGKRSLQQQPLLGLPYSEA